MKRNIRQWLAAIVLLAAMLPLFGNGCTVDIDGFVRPRSFSGVIDVFFDDDDDDFFDELGDFFDDLDDDDFFDDHHHHDHDDDFFDWF